MQEYRKSLLQLMRKLNQLCSRRFTAVLLLLLMLQYCVNILIYNGGYLKTLKSLSDHYLATCLFDDHVNGTSNTVFCRGYDKLNPYLRLLPKGDHIALALCPDKPINLVGHIPVIYSSLSMSKLAQLHPELEDGGRWRPSNCTARHKVALIIPFRERQYHLRILLFHLHPFLQKQQIDYGIYVVEQTKNTPFNRGMLMNIGFVESNKLYNYDCHIFHDVDLLPENDLNLYWCPPLPRHMSVAVNTMAYRLPYDNIFGGIEAFRTEHFRLVNGFSNVFFGWGGEDDDLYMRVMFHKLNITRYPMHIARYKMLGHQKQSANPNRNQLLQTGDERFDSDGLSNLRYTLHRIVQRRLYTWILVSLNNSSAVTNNKKQFHLQNLIFGDRIIDNL